MESPEEGWDSSEEWESSGESSAHTGCESDTYSMYSQGFLSIIWEESTQAGSTVAGGEFAVGDFSDSANRDLWKSIASLNSAGEQVHYSLSDDDTSLSDNVNRVLRKTMTGEEGQYLTSDDEYTLSTIESNLVDEGPTVRRWSSDFSYESVSMSLGEGQSVESSSITSSSDYPGPPGPPGSRPPYSSQTMMTAPVDPDETPKASSHKRIDKTNSVFAEGVSEYLTPEFSSDDDDELELDSPTPPKLGPKLGPSQTAAPHVPVRQKSLERKEDAPFVRIRPNSPEVGGDAPGAPIRQKSLEFLLEDEDALHAPHMPMRKNSLDDSGSHRIKSMSVTVDDDQRDAHLVVEDHLLRQADKSPRERQRDHGQHKKLKFHVARYAISPRIEKMISSRMEDLVDQNQALMLSPLFNTQPQSLPSQQQQESKTAEVSRLSHRESKRIRIRKMMQQTEERLNDLMDPAAEQHGSEEQSGERLLIDLSSTDVLPEGSSELSHDNVSSKDEEPFSGSRHISMDGNIGICHKPENPDTISPRRETMISSRMDDLVEQVQALMPTLPNTQPLSLPSQQQQENKIAEGRRLAHRLAHRQAKRIRIQRKMQQMEARLNYLLDPAAEHYGKEEELVETLMINLSSTDLLPEGSPELAHDNSSSKHREPFSSTSPICMDGEISMYHKPENPDALSPRIEKVISSIMEDLVEQNQSLMPPPFSNTQSQALPSQQQQENKIAQGRRLAHRESKRIRIRRKMQQTEARLNDLLDPAAEEHDNQVQSVERLMIDLSSTDFLSEGSSEFSFHNLSSKHKGDFSTSRHISMAGNIGIRHITVSKPGERSQQ